jgi:hypothetical protein
MRRGYTKGGESAERHRHNRLVDAEDLELDAGIRGMLPRDSGPSFKPALAIRRACPVAGQ